MGGLFRKGRRERQARKYRTSSLEKDEWKAQRENEKAQVKIIIIILM